MKNPTRRSALACGLIVLILSGVASAHAFLDRADPKVGAEVAAPPKQVRIWFTQPVEPAFSRIEVFDASGKQVDKKDTRVADGEKKLLLVSLDAVPPGAYRVVWSVVSTDTHRTKGDFKFVVK